MDLNRVGTRSAVAISFIGGAVSAWVLAHRCDRRSLAADPEQARLSQHLQGRPALVTSADGTILHAEVHGPERGPTIVLSHGWACSKSLWHYQLQALREEFRLVTYDHRGHGQSQPAAGGDYSTDALAADLQAVVRECVPEGERAVVVGHSMGAMSVVAWADRYPEAVDERLAGAVLANTCMAGLVREAELVVTVAALARVRDALGRTLLSRPLRVPSTPMPIALRVVRYVAFGSHASPAHVAFSWRMFLGCPPDVRAGFGATLSDLDQQHAIGALRVPVVVIVGDADRVTPPRHARALSQTLADAELVELDGVGHMAPLEAHAAVTDAIRRLTQRVLPTGSEPGAPAPVR